MEKSSRRLRRQIRVKMSSGMATGCLPGEVGAFSETTALVLVSLGLLFVNKPRRPPPPCKWQQGHRWSQRTPGLPAQHPPPLWGPGPAKASARSVGRVQRSCLESPVSCHSFHPQDRIHPVGRVALSSPVPTPLGNKTKTPSYPTGNGDWRLFPVLFGTHETN